MLLLGVSMFGLAGGFHPSFDRPHGRHRRIVTGLDGLSGDLILDHAFGLVLVLARIGATLALLPGLGEATIPAL